MELSQVKNSSDSDSSFQRKFYKAAKLNEDTIRYITPTHKSFPCTKHLCFLSLCCMIQQAHLGLCRYQRKEIISDCNRASMFSTELTDNHLHTHRVFTETESTNLYQNICSMALQPNFSLMQTEGGVGWMKGDTQER